MEELVSCVNYQNFYLGCRVCRQLLVKSNSIFFQDQIPDMDGVCYSDAFVECTSLEITQNDELPNRLCADCAARLTIAYQFRKEAVESDKLLRSYSELEKKEENEMYENSKYQVEEMFEYETIEELDDETMNQDDGKGEINFNDTSTADESGGNDAVSFLTGIIAKKSTETSKQHFEVKKVKPKPVTDSGLDDANRKHVCNVCNKKFQKRSNLIDHLRLHANVKIFLCNFCEKSFVQAGNFKAHLRTHTKEKPYQCNYCSKAYSQSSSLKIHIRSHTQEKNYVCDFCEKAFTNASDLGKHKLIHDPVKKYRCEECQRPFTQKIHLKKHLEKHHPDGAFEIILKPEKIEDNTKIIFEECTEDDAND